MCENSALQPFALPWQSRQTVPIATTAMKPRVPHHRRSHDFVGETFAPEGYVCIKAHQCDKCDNRPKPIVTSAKVYLASRTGTAGGTRP